MVHLNFLSLEKEEFWTWKLMTVTAILGFCAYSLFVFGEGTPQKSNRKIPKTATYKKPEPLFKVQTIIVSFRGMVDRNSCFLGSYKVSVDSFSCNKITVVGLKVKSEDQKVWIVYGKLRIMGVFLLGIYILKIQPQPQMHVENIWKS